MDTTGTTREEISADYRLTPGLCSLVSIPWRNRRWGSSSYRGNCDGTLFKDLVLWYKPRSVADPMLGSGTTADVMHGLREAGAYRGRFWGSDLKRGFNLLTTPMPGNFEFVWIHPPYWDIIRYSDTPGDLSTLSSYESFIGALATCLERCYEALVPGGRLAVLVGDVRRRGRYYGLGHDVMALAGRLGELRSVIIKAQHNCTSDSKRYGTLEDPPIKHEYCIVFKKPPSTVAGSAAA
jgi:hypothetical protein